MRTLTIFTTIFLFILESASICFATTFSGDWSGVEESPVEVFYPGQTSWEWILTQHPGATNIRSGMNCLSCHKGQEALMARKILFNKRLDRRPNREAPSNLTLNISVAMDEDFLFVKVRWMSPKNKPEFNNKSILSVSLANNRTKGGSVSGCWSACHSDNMEMPYDDESGRTLYLPSSRTKLLRKGGGDNIKPQKALQNMLNNEEYLETWRVDLHKSRDAIVNSGYILAKRQQLDKPLTEARAMHNNDEWTVIFKRPLRSNGKGQLNIDPNKEYYINFALHAGEITGRHHLVSLIRTISATDTKANIHIKRF